MDELSRRYAQAVDSRMAVERELKELIRDKRRLQIQVRNGEIEQEEFDLFQERVHEKVEELENLEGTIEELGDRLYGEDDRLNIC